MALGTPIALSIQQPQISAVGNFLTSQSNAIDRRSAEMAQASAELQAKQDAMKGFYALSAGVLRDGVVNPDEWESALDVIEQGGADPQFVGRLRGRPEMAEVLANSSSEGLKYLQNERMLDLEYEKLLAEISRDQQADQKAADDASSIDAILRKHAPDIADAYKSGMLDGPKAYEELQKRLNPDQGREAPPSGYRYTDVGDLEATPGGPADPNNPLNQKKLLSDRQLSATEQKELWEADDAVKAGENAIPMIERMVDLNTRAWDGPLADAGTSIGSLFGDANSVDTQELRNLTTAQALEQLKAVFGAMPTEGERKILLEIQGSVGQSRAVRERIYGRALDMAKRRVEMNRAKMESIQTGDYRRVGGNTGSGGALEAPAIGTVEDGHRFLGGDPGDPNNWEVAQ